MRVEWFDQAGGEPVRLVASTPEWAAVAAEWCTAIAAAIHLDDVTVEHVGSTSVPGLIAKPVIDLLVAVPNVEDEIAYRSALETLGLVLRMREPGHRFFRPPAGSPRTVHVHVCQRGSIQEDEYVRFRDALRNDPTTAIAYTDLKQRLARTVGHDRTAYTAAKATFIRSVLNRPRS